MYSDQPTMPSSVVTLRNEFVRQPASQCRSSTLTIFIGILLENAVQVIRRLPIVPGRALVGDVCRVGVGILYMCNSGYGERNGVFSTAPASIEFERRRNPLHFRAAVANHKLLKINNLRLLCCGARRRNFLHLVKPAVRNVIVSI